MRDRLVFKKIQTSLLLLVTILHVLSTMRLILYCACLFSLFGFIWSAEKCLTLNLDETKSVRLLSGDTLIFEVPKQAKLSVTSLFFRLAVVVSAERSDGSIYRFPFHSIRGVSTDDSHAHFSSLANSIINKIHPTKESASSMNEQTPLAQQVSYTSNFIRNFIRDIFSSCPSPLFGHSSRHRCVMSLSPYGAASVSVRPKASESIVIQATTQKQFMFQYLIYIVMAILFLLFSDQFSKSKIFQYSCGMITFVVVGLALILLSLTGTVKPKSTIIQNASLFTLLTGAYGASLVWFLQSYLSLILAEFWEFTAIYVLLFSFFGAWTVRYIRSNQHTKHVFRVMVKWMIRAVGLYLLFNASASPAVSWTYMLVFLVLYTIYESLKRAAGLRKRD